VRLFNVRDRKREHLKRGGSPPSVLEQPENRVTDRLADLREMRQRIGIGENRGYRVYIVIVRDDGVMDAPDRPAPPINLFPTRLDLDDDDVRGGVGRR
jgi:hypothetical protein